MADFQEWICFHGRYKAATELLLLTVEINTAKLNSFGGGNLCFSFLKGKYCEVLQKHFSSQICIWSEHTIRHTAEPPCSL